MGKKDQRVDAYIARSAAFARPVLNHLRKVVHEGCPEVEETLKWGFPHFMHKGILCSMASFKAHCAFSFWKGKLLEEKLRGVARGKGPAMGDFGRLTSLSDLPSERVLIRCVREAAALNDKGVRGPNRRSPKGERKLEVPGDFLRALKKNRRALATFEGFSPANKRDYVEWVTGAKREETRKRRLETAIAWMAEGKVRNWKYVGN